MANGYHQNIFKSLNNERTKNNLQVMTSRCHDKSLICGFILLQGFAQ